MLRNTRGEVFVGLLAAKSETEVVLKDSTFELRHVPVNEIKKLAPSPVSLMPSGMLIDMTAQEAADLLEYLFSLK